jgi:hypothetical protein
MGSQRSLTLHLSELHSVELANWEDATAKTWNMDDWTIAQEKITLAQAFGISKGTIDFPKLKAQLPPVVSQSKSSQNAPTSDSSAPTAADEHQNYLLAQKMAAQQPFNWTGDQFTALNNIVMAESGWNTQAENPSGAYGIPQALPGSKMASAGKDWQSDARTQIAWMLEYIRSRYGTPVAAWQFHLANGWY